MDSDQAPARRFPRWLKAFIPTKDVAVTPLLISANVIIWLVMIATGVSPYAPSVEDVIRWGANYSDAVSHGEYWRLWTSNYLHYGILHLGVNMLSLNNVGRLLERFIGKWRFALLYTVTGIFASSISIWWNQYAIGVGASGAILGIVGVLTAILTTNLIDKTIRMQMLRSIGFSILLMLLLGLNPHIDNAAHIGGLLSGAVGGYFIYPELRAFYYERKINYLGLIASVLLIAGGTLFFVMKAEPVRLLDDILNDLKRHENIAETNFGKNQFTTPESVNEHVISVYERGLRQLDTLEEMDLTEEGQAMVSSYRKYINARIKYYEFVSRSMTGDSALADSAEKWRILSDKIKPIIILTDE